MNRSFYLQLFVSMVALATVTLLWVIPAQAQFNEQINYQGRLLDSTGSAVADGTYAMSFRLYTVATSGSAIWTETLSGSNEVTVIDGLFSVMLGSTTPLSSVDFNQTLYLGVTIEADSEMAPRKILGAVPAAFVANEANNANTVGGVASTSLLRNDQAGTVTASSSSSIFSVIQNGLGKVASFFSGVTEVFTILNNGNVGIGTTTPTSRLAVAGNAVIGGNLTATGTLSVGTLDGLLLGTSGTVSAVATSGLNIAIGDTIGTLSATRGGTGLTTITQNQLLIGGAGNTWTQVATTTLGLATPFSNSAQLSALLSDETGSTNNGVAVFSYAPTFTGLSSFGSTTNSGLLTVAGTSTLATTTIASSTIGTLNLTNALSLAMGGTGATTAAGARTNLGATTIGSNIFTLTNPSSSTLLRLNADNTVSAISTSTLNIDLLNTVGTLGATRGGTGLTSYATGDLIYASGANTLANRTIGSTGNILSVVGGVPTWVATSTFNINTTNLTGLGTNVATFLGAPSSANLAAALTDETGSTNGGMAVFSYAPTFTGLASFGSTTNSGILTVAGTSTLATTTVTDLTIARALRDTTGSAGTAGMVLQTTGTTTRWVATSTLGLGGSGSIFASDIDTSAKLAGVLTDETGSAGGGLVVFSNAPTFTGITNFADLIATNATTTNASTTQLAISSLTSGRLAYVGTGGRLIDSTNLLFDGSRLATLNLAVTGTSTFSGTSTMATTTIASSTIGTLNLTNALAIAMGGTGATTASGARTNLGATTIGSNIFTLTNPSSSTILRLNADNTVSAISTSTLNIDLLNTVGTLGATRGGTGLTTTTQNQLLIGGAGNTWTQIATTSLGLATPFSTSAQLAALLSDETGTGNFVLSDSPAFTGTATFASTSNSGLLTVAGTTTLATSTITSLTLGNALAITSGGTGATSASGARTNLGATTIGSNIFTLTNPSSSTILRLNADNTVSALSTSSLNIDLGNTVGTLGATRGGTGLSSYATGDLIYASGANTLANRTIGSTGNVLSVVGGVPTWVATSTFNINTANLTGLGTNVATFLGTPSSANLAAALTDETGSTNGGAAVFSYAPTFTGLASFGSTTNSGILTVAGTSTLATTTITDLTITRALRDTSGSAGTLGMILQTTGTSTYWVATSTLGISSGSTFTNSAQLAALLSDETGSVGGGLAVFSISPAFTGTATFASTTNSGLLTVAGTSTLATTTIASSTIGTLNLSNALSLAMGGTGATTAAGARTNLGATTVGSNIFTLTNPSSSTLLRLNADNTVSAISTSTLNIDLGNTVGTLGATRGGTGLTSYATGDLIYASGANTLANRTIGSTGNILSVVGGVPTWVATSSLNIAGLSLFTDGGATTYPTSLNENFGVGTTSSTSKLTVQGDSGSLDIFNVASSTGASVLKVMANSNVELSGQLIDAGVTWTARPALGENDSWTSVTYGNGLFVAVSQAGDRIMTSPDGINWTARSITGNNDTWNDVTYGNGMFVAIGSGTGDYIATSPDGINWTARALAGSNGYEDITYGNGRFVAVGTGPFQHILTSPDGINWTASFAPGNNDGWTSVVYGDGKFVAVSLTGDRVMYSTDGTSWATTTAAGDNDSWASVTYGNGQYVAVADSGDDRIMTSPDGITWTGRSALGNDETWAGVTYGNGLFVAVSGAVGLDRIATSPDGINWTSRRTSSRYADVAYGNGMFVAVGYNGDHVLTSGYIRENRLATNNVYQDISSFVSGLNVGSSTTASSSSTGTLMIFGRAGSNPFSVASSSGTNLLTLTSAGQLGLGSSSPSSLLTVAGTAQITGTTTLATTSLSASLLDFTGSAGTLGMVLQTTGTTTRWVATSTLGISSGSSFTNSAQLAALLSDETGSTNGGVAVFSYAPTFTGLSSFGSTTNSGLLTVAGTTTLATTTIASSTIGTLNLTNALAVAMGGTGATTQSGARTNLGATTIGSNIFTLTNPSSSTILRLNADNTVSALSTSSLNIDLGNTVGTLGGTRGGTGLSTVTNNQLLIGGAGNTWTQAATTTLGLATPFSTSAQLAALLSDETGSTNNGVAVYSYAPTFTGLASFGSTTNSGILTVAGTSTLATTSLTRALLDVGGSSGTNGMVLLSTGTSTRWAATSTLGITGGGGSSLFTDGGATTYLTAVGDNLAIGTTSASERLTINGNMNFLGGTAGINWNGLRVLSASTTKDNYLFGYQAGESITTGSNLIAIGWQALPNATSTSDNIAIGKEAGFNVTSGNANVFIGPWGAGNSNTTGSRNVFIGHLAGYNNSTGGENTYIGYGVAQDSGSGSNNSFFGSYAGYNLTTSNSVLFGGSAGFNGNPNYTADNLTLVGYAAGADLQTGANNNILIGYNAANSLTTGANNLIIGYDVEAPSNTASNQLNIGNLIFGTGVDGAGTTLSSGNIGIGSTSPNAKLTVAGTFQATATSTLSTTTLTAALLDVGGSSGTNGMVLLSTGTSTRWAATSTLGITGGGGSSLFTDGGATTYLTAVGDNLGIGTTSASEKLTVNGNINLLGNTAALNWNGDRILSASTTLNNYIFGQYAGDSITDGGNNIAIGYNALTSVDTGSGNVSIGTNAGLNNTLGSDNVFIGGGFTGYSNTEGTDNIFIGYAAGGNNTTGSGNVMIGNSAGNALVSGGDNTVYGRFAALSLSTTSQSTIVGHGAAYGIAGAYEADNLTIFGREAGYNLQTGANNNILIGYNAANSMTTGANNLIIGYDVEAPSNTASNQLNIGNLIFGTGIDGTGTTLSSGNIGIGTTSPMAKLTVDGTFRATATSTLASTSISGTLQMGTTSLASRFVLDVNNFSTAGIAGLNRFYTSTNAASGTVQFGEQAYFKNSATATTTIVGSMFRIEDNGTLGNTVRGLEVQANRGTNTQGENTALSGFARTFGVRGFSSGDAGSRFEPAGGYFETGGTTQGNAIRGYSSTITSANLLALFQDTSTFAGTGLNIDLGNGTGSFTGKFVDLKVAGSSRFNVASTGTMFTIGDISITATNTDPAANNVVGQYFGANGFASINRSANPAMNLGRSNDGAVLQFYSAGAVQGSVSIAGATVSYNAFTGSHFGLVPADAATSSYEKGTLLELTGENEYYNDDATSEIVYGMQKTTTENSSRVIGTYLASLEPSRPQSTANPTLVMAVGNGHMWVADQGEDIKAGDYLISSNIAGHAEKDNSTSSVSYIIARASEDIAWDEVTTEINGVKHKRITVFFENFVRPNINLALIASSTVELADIESASQTGQFMAGLFAKLTTWFGSAQNGIEDMYANVFNAKERICVDGECLTADDIRNLKGALQSGGSSNPPPSNGGAPGASEPPPAGGGTGDAGGGESDDGESGGGETGDAPDEAPPGAGDSGDGSEAPPAGGDEGGSGDQGSSGG